MGRIKSVMILTVVCAPLCALAADPGWAFETLFEFTGREPNGAYAGVAIGGDGTLYGTTEDSAYALAPPAEPGGKWKGTVLSYLRNADGRNPLYSSA